MLTLALLVAIGMPLVHPLLHRHGDCGHASHAQSGEQVRSEKHTGHLQECPLCGFLATHQLHFTAAHRPEFTDETIERYNCSAFALPVKPRPSTVAVRAPPSAVPTF